jgi:hypothetical protein
LYQASEQILARPVSTGRVFVFGGLFMRPIMITAFAAMALGNGKTRGASYSYPIKSKLATTVATFILVSSAIAQTADKSAGNVTAEAAAKSAIVDWLTDAGYWAIDCSKGVGTILRRSGSKLEHLNANGQVRGFANYRAASANELLLDYIKGGDIFSSITQRIEKTGENSLRSTLSIDGNTQMDDLQRCSCDKASAEAQGFCRRTVDDSNHAADPAQRQPSNTISAVTPAAPPSQWVSPSSPPQLQSSASAMLATDKVTALRHWSTYKGVALYTPIDQDCRGVATIILAAHTDALAQAVARDIPFAMGASMRAAKQMPEYRYGVVRSGTYNGVAFGTVEEGYCSKVNILNALVFSGSDRYLEVSLARDGHGPASVWKSDLRLLSHFTTKRPHPTWLAYVELQWFSPLSGVDYNMAVGKLLDEVRKLPAGEDYWNKSKEKVLSCDLRTLQSNMAVVVSSEVSVTAESACDLISGRVGEIRYIPPAPIAVVNDVPTELGVQDAVNRALMATCDGQGAIRDLIPGLNLLGRSRSEDDWCKISAMGVEGNMRFGKVSNLSCQGSTSTSFICKYSTPLICHINSVWDKGRDSFTSTQACPWGTQIGNMHHEFKWSGKQLQLIRVLE